MGFCVEFGTVITDGCDHRMQATSSSCECRECGTVCRGRFKGCPQVWALSTATGAASAATGAAPTGAAPTATATGKSRKPATAEKAGPQNAAATRPAEKAPAPDTDKAFQRLARQIDDRAAAHAQALEHQRVKLAEDLRASVAAELPALVAAELPALVAAELRASVAEALPTMVAAHLPNMVAAELRASVADLLPAMVAEAVARATPSLPADQAPDQAHAQAPATRPDPLSASRLRSLEKRLEGVARRAQEVDDRVDKHLRSIDEDRTMLTQVLRRQDRLAQAVAEADPTGLGQQVVDWVESAVPVMVAGAVEAALGERAAAIAEAGERAERAMADTEAMGQNMLSSAELLLERLFRQDEEAGRRIEEHLGDLEEQRAALADLLQRSKDELVESAAANVAPMVDGAVRTAMERYVDDRRASAAELIGRLRDDAEVMRHGIQRAFEKTLERLVSREMELDDRAAGHLRALEAERQSLHRLGDDVERSVTQALPGLVAEAVREQIDEARQETARLRSDTEAATAELREALAEVKAALARYNDGLDRQGAAYQRAFAEMRETLARPTADPEQITRTAETASTPPGGPEPVAVDRTNGGRVKLGPSVVPPAQRVERRMLRIPDGPHPWPSLEQRHSHLSELLDSPGPDPSTS